MGRNMTEKRILQAAIDVVAKKTISGTRVHLIAQEAGMVQSNVHYYFKTKKDLLIAMLEEIQENFNKKRAEFLAQSDDTLKSDLQSFFNQKKDVILNDKKYDFVQYDFWVFSSIDEEISKSFKKSYELWRESIIAVIYKHKPDINDEKLSVISHIMVSMMIGASMQYLIEEGSFDLDKYFSMCEKLIIDSIIN